MEDPPVQTGIEPPAEARTEAASTAEPGWYPFDGRLRRWDGKAWTHDWRRTEEKTWSNAAQVGMFLGIFLWPVGFLMGLALVAGRDRHAHWVVLTSIAAPVVAVLLWAS